MKQRRFIFTKDYNTEEGTIKKGFELLLFRGVFYLNGAMCAVRYQKMFDRIINDPQIMKEFVKEVPPTPNKV